MTEPRVKPSWYEAPTDGDAKKEYDKQVAIALVEAQARGEKQITARSDNEVALDKVRAENAEALRKAQVESDEKTFVATIEALRTATTGSIERSRDTAKYVQTASIAAAGLYTGLLGFVFGIADTAADLPVRAAISTIFFGFAVAFSTWYLAYIPDRGGTLRWPPPSSLPLENARRNFNFVVDWINAVTLARAWAMRAAAFYLLLAIAFLPAAFIEPPFDVAKAATTLRSWIAASPASTDAPVVTPSPDPTVAPTWPPPPDIAQAKVALELYKRQLDAFEKEQAGAPDAPGRGWDTVLYIIALVAFLVATRIARRTPPADVDDDDPGGDGPGEDGPTNRLGNWIGRRAGIVGLRYRP